MLNMLMRVYYLLMIRDFGNGAGDGPSPDVNYLVDSAGNYLTDSAGNRLTTS